jgi:hypothetical protein
MSCALLIAEEHIVFSQKPIVENFVSLACLRLEDESASNIAH